MKFSPGSWSERLVDGGIGGPDGEVHNLGDYGEDTAAQVMAVAQECVSRFTVAIGNTGVAKDSTNVKDIVPGSGVLVQINGNIFGVLTAGHVLRRGNNTKRGVSVAIFVPPRSSQQGGDVMRIDLPFRRCTVDGFDNDSEEGPDIAIIPLDNEEWKVLDGWGMVACQQGGDVMRIDLPFRRCTVDGFDNDSEEGPDIAIIPLDNEEWKVLDGWGMVAYNLDKVRWSEEDKAEVMKLKPWMLSIINGVRFEASQIVYGHTDGKRGSLAIVTTNTRVDLVAERGGHDYLELPSETTKHSYPTHWRNKLPGTAAKEIEDLHAEGVTRKVWGGTSGAGVWNLVVGTADSGLPNGKVLVELAGICFYADQGKGCVVAHGTKSIANVAAQHVQKGALCFPRRV